MKTLIDRIHELGAKIGISPKLLDPFIGGTVYIVAAWALGGQPFDLEGLKTLGFILVLGALGLAAPPAPNVKQAEVEALSKIPKTQRPEKVQAARRR